MGVIVTLKAFDGSAIELIGNLSDLEPEFWPVDNKWDDPDDDDDEDYEDWEEDDDDEDDDASDDW